MKAPTESKAHQWVGQVLRGKWHVDRVVAVGGMATVFEATHRNGNHVAIKMLHPMYALNPETKDRFLEEGYVANRVDHPGTVKVLDDDELEDGTAFLVMELLEGESLEGRLKAPDVLSVPAIALIADRVLDVLGAGHAKGVFHRDIKPANIFLTNDGNVKVLDYGLARVRERSLQGAKTKTGMVIGTASYMPPEQARGRHDLIDARTDIWAVGATMFKALSGRYVHEAGTINERLFAAMSERARSIETVTQDLPRPIAQVIDKALEFKPADRWQSASAMQTALRGAYEASLGESLPGGERQPMSMSWSQAAGVHRAVDPADVDVQVSVVFDPDPSGTSIVVEVESEGKKAERFELRRKSEPEDDDEIHEDDLCDVDVVGLPD